MMTIGMFEPKPNAPRTKQPNRWIVATAATTHHSSPAKGAMPALSQSVIQTLSRAGFWGRVSGEGFIRQVLP